MAVDALIQTQFLDRLNDGPRPETLTLADFRSAVEHMTSLCAPAPAVDLVRDGKAGTGGQGVPYRLYHPCPDQLLPLVVYFHGGGWTAGSIEFTDPLLRRIAVETRTAILNVGYRLAPEHPFPAALDDAMAVTEWASQHAAELNGDASRLIMVGNSAGAALAATVTMQAKDTDLDIRHQMLLCPALDPRMDTLSYREFAEGYQNSASMMQWCWRTYLNRPHGSLDDVPWQAAPALASDLSGLPPATVITAEYDPLRDEGEGYAARLAAAGVPVTLVRCPGLIHCALHLEAVAPAAGALREHATSALRSAVCASGEVIW